VVEFLIKICPFVPPAGIGKGSPSKKNNCPLDALLGRVAE
jgi:hypothetical protein